MRNLNAHAPLALPLIAATLFFFAAAGGSTLAQTAPVPPASPAPQAAPANEAASQQVQLTERQIQGLLAAQKPLADLFEKIPEDKRDEPDAKVQADLDKIARQFGFADYGELDAVGGNVNFILEGFDPQTKAFVGHETVLVREIAEVAKDKSIPARDRDAQLKEMRDALASIEPVKFPGNIALVTKYYDKLSEALNQ